jgi:uncharacterized membrane protein (UPF0127 family)
MDFGVRIRSRELSARFAASIPDFERPEGSASGFLALVITPLFLFTWVLCGFCEPPADMSPYAGPSGKARVAPVTVGALKVNAVVADTHTGKVKGFLGWERVSEDEGMLLDFGIESSYSIHMQGMKFPIDAIWADSRGVVNAVYHDIKPNSGLIYPALSPSRYCLEVKAGMAKQAGVKIGDKMEFGMPRAVGK